MKHTTGSFPRVEVDTAGSGVVSSAGALLLVRAARAVGVDAALASALSPWQKPLATHRPGKVLLDLAVTLAVGGDCLADIAVLRAEPGLFGRVASDATVSRTVATLAAENTATRALQAMKNARAAARARAWALAGTQSPAAGPGPLVIDLDATLVTAHSEKEGAAPTFKKGFGHHPLWAFMDHGAAGTGEPLAVLLRNGNAGSNTAADHITVVKDALAQLPKTVKRGRNVLIRTDGAGCTHAFLEWLTARGRGLGYSVGFPLTDKHAESIARIPEQAWTPAYDAGGQVRDGAWVAEATGVLDVAGWPTGMRVIVRKERPHPGAQLTFTDVDGLRLTAFATNTRGPGPGLQLPDLELRHRSRARAEDRIRCAKDTGLRNLPLHGFAQNEIWLQIVSLACELTAWTQLLAYPDHAPPPMGTETTPATAVLPRRASRQNRPAHPAAPPEPSPLGRPHPDRPHPTRHPHGTGLTLTPNAPTIRQPAVEPAPPETTSAALSHPDATISSQPWLTPRNDDQHWPGARSGLGRVRSSRGLTHPLASCWRSVSPSLSPEGEQGRVRPERPAKRAL